MQTFCSSKVVHFANCSSLLIWNKPIFAGETTGRLFVLGQYFGGPYGDQEKTPKDSEAGEQRVW